MAIGTVLRNEVQLLKADRLLVAALVVFAVLFSYALANGVAWASKLEGTVEAVRAADAERAASLVEELEHIAAGGDPVSRFTDPRSPNVMGGARGAVTAVLEPGPLAALSAGQTDLLPYYYDVSIYTNEQTFLQNGEVANPLNLMVGRFDLAFVIVYLLPLLVLALGYNVLSAEREQGTLALTLSQPVSARTVVTAKLLFRGMIVIGVALAASLVGVAVGGGWSAPERVALWCATVVVYSLFWFALAAWVNTLGRSSAWNATALVGAWLALVVVVPSTVNVAAGLLHPPPSRIAMISEARQASNDAVNQRSILLARYLEDHPEMAVGVVPDRRNTAALAWAATEEVNRRLEGVANRHDQALAAQRTMVRRYGLLSPALVAHGVLSSAAGNDDERFERFETQVRGFAEEWKEYFVPAILEGRSMELNAVAERPAFDFVEESQAQVIGRTTLPLLWLTLLAGLAIAPAVVGLGRVRGAE